MAESSEHCEVIAEDYALGSYLIVPFKFTVQGCIQKFLDWLPGAGTVNGTALCHGVQLYRYFVSQSSEFCRHNHLCCFTTSVYSW